MGHPSNPIMSITVDVIELRRRVGMVLQKWNPFPKSIYENVIYGLRIAGVKDKATLDETVEKSLKRAALWDEVKDRLYQPAMGLSGGQMHLDGADHVKSLSGFYVILKCWQRVGIYVKSKDDQDRIGANRAVSCNFVLFSCLANSFSGPVEPQQGSFGKVAEKPLGGKSWQNRHSASASTTIPALTPI